MYQLISFSLLLTVILGASHNNSPNEILVGNEPCYCTKYNPGGSYYGIEIVPSNQCPNVKDARSKGGTINGGLVLTAEKVSGRKSKGNEPCYCHIYKTHNSNPYGPHSSFKNKTYYYGTEIRPSNLCPTTKVVTTGVNQKGGTVNGGSVLLATDITNLKKSISATTNSIKVSNQKIQSEIDISLKNYEEEIRTDVIDYLDAIPLNMLQEKSINLIQLSLETKYEEKINQLQLQIDELKSKID